MRLPELGGDFDTGLHNYFLFQREFGVRDGRVLRQVHGKAIVSADGQPRQAVWPVIVGEGDAIWTSERGVWVGVFTADCLAILLDAGDRVMAVHAGWRGFAAGLIGDAVQFLGGGAAIRSATLSACARKCCYEVGEEVVRGIEAAGIEPVLAGQKLDLVDTASGHLSRLGVATIIPPPGAGCSICQPGVASFRRDGAAAGRNLSVITPGH